MTDEFICDSNEIKQITCNVHNKKADIYIPCITVFDSFIGEENEFSFSSEVFFEYAAQRKDPVRVFRSSPIQDVLHEIAINSQQNISQTISNTVQLVFSATEPPLFNSVTTPELSIFEKALIIKEDCGDAANIIILSNHKNIGVVKAQAEKESKSKFNEPEISILNTNEWLERNYQKGEVSSLMINLMKTKGKKSIKLGGFQIHIEYD